MLTFKQTASRRPRFVKQLQGWNGVIGWREWSQRGGLGYRVPIYGYREIIVRTIFTKVTTERLRLS